MPSMLHNCIPNDQDHKISAMRRDVTRFACQWMLSLSLYISCHKLILVIFLAQFVFGSSRTTQAQTSQQLLTI